MAISITSRFVFTADSPIDALLQFEAAQIPEQELLDCRTELSDSEHCARIEADEDIGQRVWVRTQGRFEAEHRARVEIHRQIVDLPKLERLDPHQLPTAAVKYLFDSRYCLGSQFQSLVESEFADTAGGARVQAILDWVTQKIAYEPGRSDANTTALDSFVERAGICRDFAHIVISMVRASAIPARYVACYAPDVTPQDFHAVAEVFLNDPVTEGGGTWQLIDATGMARPDEIVKIGVGRDAADVSFMTTFGQIELCEKDVSVERD